MANALNENTFVYTYLSLNIAKVLFGQRTTDNGRAVAGETWFKV